MRVKRDLILIVALLALAGGALWLVPALQRAPGDAAEGLYVRYSYDGVAQATLPLDAERELTLDQGDGRVNVLHLSPSGVVMQSASCYNQSCVHQGEVTLANRASRPLYNMIVCAPHRLVVELLTAAEALAHE